MESTQTGKMVIDWYEVFDTLCSDLDIQGLVDWKEGIVDIVAQKGTKAAYKASNLAITIINNHITARSS